jgi:hypothetical protein
VAGSPHGISLAPVHVLDDEVYVCASQDEQGNCVERLRMRRTGRLVAAEDRAGSSGEQVVPSTGPRFELGHRISHRRILSACSGS